MKKLNLLLLAFTLILASCSQEEINDPDTAFSSDSECKVWTDETIVEDESYFDYVGKIYGNVVGINESEDSDGKFYNLGFIVTENSQNPGQVWALVNPETSTWRRLNECRSSNIAGFWDGLSKNQAKDVRIIQQGTDRTKVYVFYGNSAKNFLRFRVDQGEVLKEFGNPQKLKGGISGTTLFFHDSDRADFPANWLGVKRGQTLFNFGADLTSMPTKIPVRRNGFGGEDLNKNVKKIRGYWAPNKQRIIIERKVNGEIITHTLQKERKNGINFYKT